MTAGTTLTAEELRVLACLVEKSYTTPDQYPLSSNAITTACNQKSSRDPVVDYPVKLVDETLQLLRDAGWVRMIRSSGNRTFKHRHVVDEVLGVSTPQLALLAVLALRGPQAPGELKTRTERYHRFTDPADVERTLLSLRDREPPLVHNVGRESGQSQDRWVQLLGEIDPEVDLSVVRAPSASASAEPQTEPPGEASAAGPISKAAAERNGPAPTADGRPLVRSESAPVPASRSSAPSEVAEVSNGFDGSAGGTAPLIDCLQYSNWSEKIFRQLRDGGVSAVHATIAYHESFREMVHNLEEWNGWFERFDDLIFPGRTGDDVRRANAEGRTAVFFGFQNPSPIEDDLGLVEICHTLGIRFMQLTYNNQSLLATGCYEDDDTGVTRFGRQVIAEMNRVGLVIDMSHSAERSTLDAIAVSERPIAITHANPAWWHPALRNKSDEVLRALTESGGMLGFSLYPHHLADGSACTVESFCEMVAEAAMRYGVSALGIGSDLCQDQPDSVVAWMRNGRWTKTIDYGEGSADAPGFPPQPSWFGDSRDFGNIGAGLLDVGFGDGEVADIMGGNWLRFYDASFGPSALTPAVAASPS